MDPVNDALALDRPRSVAGDGPEQAGALALIAVAGALQFSIAHPDMATCIVGSANPENVKKWAQWAAEPVDEPLIGEVREILKPIHNWFYVEGRPENNDPL